MALAEIIQGSVEEIADYLKQFKGRQNLMLIVPIKAEDADVTESVKKGDMTMRYFRDDDTGYIQWLEAHPDGFVVGCDSDPKVDSHGIVGVLHRAKCGHVKRPGVSYTSADYIKLYADTIEPLEAWAAEVGGKLSPCGVCDPNRS